MKRYLLIILIIPCFNIEALFAQTEPSSNDCKSFFEKGKFVYANMSQEESSVLEVDEGIYVEVLPDGKGEISSKITWWDSCPPLMVVCK